MSYLEAIKKAVEAKKAKEQQKKSNVKYFKAEIGVHTIRFLPYTDPTNGLPWQEMHFYDSRSLSKFRMVTPSFFGKEDAILDFYNQERKTREGWLLVKDLKPRDRYFFNVLVRGKEAEGPMLWETSKEIKDQLQTIITMEENSEEDIFSPETGFDFVLTVTQATDNTGKLRVYNNYPVKKFSLVQKRNKSQLSKDKAVTKSIMEGIVNVYEMFENLCPDNKTIQEALEAFALSLSKGGSSSTKVEAEAMDSPISDDEATDATQKKLAAAFGIE